MKDIVITGVVAAGKTYLQDSLIEHYPNAQLYPEFIYNDPLAMMILRARFAGKVSALTFQSYIMDKWKQYDVPRKDINIYERLPDDAVEVFAKSFLSETELQTQRDIRSEISVISYRDMQPCLWIKYHNHIGRSLDELLTLIDSKTGFIVIEVIPDDAYSNYKMRSREGETYTRDELKMIEEIYKSYVQSIIDDIQPEIIEL